MARCAGADSEVRTEIWRIGVVAPGAARRSGMNVPWSQPFYEGRQSLHHVVDVFLLLPGKSRHDLPR